MYNAFVRFFFCALAVGFAFNGDYDRSAFGGQFGPDRQIHSSARFGAFAGYIMAIDYERRCFIVKEKKILVGNYRLRSGAGATRMKNENKEDADLKDFKLGQWVTVRGYVLSRALIHACSVQALPGYLSKDLRKIQILELRR